MQVVSTFNEREWRACYKYLKYCNKKDAQSLKVFEYVYKNRKSIFSPKLKSDTVRKKLFPKMSDRAFLNVLSDLVKDTEMFMIVDLLQQDEKSYERKEFLLDLYKQKGLYKYFESTANQMIKELASDKTVDIFRNQKWFKIHHSLYFSDLNIKQNKGANLIEAEKGLKLFTQSIDLFYDSEAYNIQNLLGNKDFRFSDTEEDDITQIVGHIHLLNTQLDRTSFDALEEVLLASSVGISGDLSQAILVSLINYCYYKIKSGEKGMINNLASLNIFGIKSGIFLINGKMSETRFLNIVDTISKSGISSSNEGFISQWITKVTSNQITSVEQLAFALWSFGKGDYADTLFLLNNSDIHLTHGNLSFRARWMYLCSLCSRYPDYNETEEVLKASATFFRRHRYKMNEQTYVGSLNLIAVIRMIWGNEKLEDIRSFLDQCDFIMFPSWIEKRLEKM